MESIIGKIVDVRFYNEQNKYIVALVESKDDGKLIVITGQMLDFQEEKLYQFDGDYVIHPKYGRQFKFICYHELLVTGHNEVVKYLSSSIFKGIGKVLANRIVETLGEDALEKIVADKDCLDKVPGITPTKKEQIYEQLNVEGNHEIATFLLQHGLHMSIVEKVMATYQENAYEMIQENPYCMLDDIENMRFKTVDQFAMSLGVDYDDINRVKALIEYTIKECCYQTGDTYLLFDQLIKKINIADRRLDQNLIGECIDLLVKQNRIYLKEDMVFSYVYEEAENGIVSKLTYFNSLFVEENTSQQIEEMIQFIQEKDHIQFATKQKKAIMDFMKYPIMILTGGPGTGKSTIVKAAIEVYRKYESTTKIALVAPTGRAAKRLSELTGLEAHTIHRLLRWDISKNEFMVNEDSPLAVDLLVIDEFSMVDTVLFHYLLKASRLVKKFLIIGDSKQLPSVLPGNVLQDMLEMDKIHQVSLDHIFRQKQTSGIVKLAHDIANDKLIDKIIFDDYSDINFIECQNIHVLEMVKKIVLKAINEGYHYYDLQVLAPMYQGIAGIDAINSMLQDVLNPPTKKKVQITHGQRIFREGDKVLQLKNRVEDNVFNGDIGIITKIILKDNFTYLSDFVIVDYEGVEVQYPLNELNQITLAYCMSIHKAQGSEFKIVIMPVLKDYHIMLKKNILYTGITRAKQSLFLIGEIEAFQKGIHNTHQHKRMTYLKQRMVLEGKQISPYDFMDE